MRLIYAQGFSKSEKLEWKPVIFNNVVQSMRVIFDAMNDCNIEFENKDNQVRETIICKHAGQNFTHLFAHPAAVRVIDDLVQAQGNPRL